VEKSYTYQRLVLPLLATKYIYLLEPNQQVTRAHQHRKSLRCSNVLFTQSDSKVSFSKLTELTLGSHLATVCKQLSHTFSELYTNNIPHPG